MYFIQFVEVKPLEPKEKMYKESHGLSGNALQMHMR